MYIGGTDEKGLHHLFAEVIDNCMDEAVAGHASWIEVEVEKDGFVAVTDNGRGMPVDPHPKFKAKSALEVIMTTLHAGGKFNSKVYDTSGGLHGVGVSVVNALSDYVEVEVARGRRLYRQRFSRGAPTEKLQDLGEVHNRRGTRVRFHPDPDIFGKGVAMQPARLFAMTRSKAYLFGGVEIRWRCDPSLIEGKDIPEKAVFHFPGGLKEYLAAELGEERTVVPIFAGKTDKASGHGAAEWAVAWFPGDGFVRSYCNTIPTAEGGTHEAGLRAALIRGLKDHAERTGNKRAAVITADDVMVSAAGLLSVFIREPEFVGQTKDRLATAAAHPHRRERDPRSLRPLARGLAQRGHEAPRLGGRAGRGAAPPPAGEGDRPPERGAETPPARQARRLLEPRQAGHRDLHRRGQLGRRLRQAGPEPRDPGRSCRSAAKSSTSPAPARRSSPRTSSSPTWCRRSGSAPARAIATTTSATSG